LYFPRRSESPKKRAFNEPKIGRWEKRQNGRDRDLAAMANMTEVLKNLRKADKIMYKTDNEI